MFNLPISLPLGVRGSPRTCLHSLLALLDKEVGTPLGPAALRHTPRLAGLAYRLVYVLCANKDTSSPTMRYLRSAHDFLFRHLQHLPFQQQDKSKTDKMLLEGLENMENEISPGKVMECVKLGRKITYGNLSHFAPEFC